MDRGIKRFDFQKRVIKMFFFRKKNFFKKNRKKSTKHTQKKGLVGEMVEIVLVNSFQVF